MTTATLEDTLTTLTIASDRRPDIAITAEVREALAAAAEAVALATAAMDSAADAQIQILTYPESEYLSSSARGIAAQSVGFAGKSVDAAHEAFTRAKALATELWTLDLEAHAKTILTWVASEAHEIDSLNSSAAHYAMESSRHSARAKDLLLFAREEDQRRN